MALTKIISFLSLTLFLVLLPTIVSANAQIFNPNVTSIVINGTVCCTLTLTGPCLFGRPVANLTVQIQRNGATIATGVSNANGTIGITIPANSTNIITQLIEVTQFKATVMTPIANCSIFPAGTTLQAPLIAVAFAVVFYV